MALGAFAYRKGLLLAIVAGAAGLAVLHVGHFQLAFLHTEKLGLNMAVRALQTGSSMGFPIEYYRTLRFFVVLNFFRRT